MKNILSITGLILSFWLVQNLSPVLAGELANQFTVGAWVKPQSSAATKAIAVKNNEMRVVTNASSQPLCQIYSGGAWQTAATSSTALSLNTWAHIACSYDKTTLRVYVNGVQTGSQALSVGLDDAATSLRVGSDEGGTYGDFNGSVDDLKIYNYARTQKQIVEDMNAGHPTGGSPVGSQVGYWRFDEGYGSTAYDVSPQSKNGTIYNATWTNNGKFGKALSFDGNTDYVSASDQDIYDFGINPFTLSTWIYPTDTTAYHFIMGKGGFWGTPEYELYILNSYAYFRVNDGAGHDGSAASLTTLQLNRWYYITGIYDGSTVKLYVDGKLNNQTANSGANLTSTYNFTIGFNSVESFTGYIDEAKVYSSALTEDEIKLDYNRGAGMVLGTLSDTSGLTGGAVASQSASAEYCVPGATDNCTPPVGEWKMDEKTGTSAYDTSGNGYTGTITDALWKSTAECKVGACLYFDGTGDEVSLGAAKFDSLTNATIEGYFYYSGTFDSNRQLFNHYKDSNNRQLVFVGYPGGWGNKLVFENIVASSNRAVTSDSTLTVGTWYHFAVTCGTGGMKMYLNGKQQASTNATTDCLSTITATTTNVIGTSFVGQIDNFKIFDYARSAAQIAWDYNRGGPVGWWKMDECQGSTIYDSGFTNNGTLTIGATGTQTSAGTCTTSGTAWYNGVTGKFNSSLNFDGTDDFINAGQVLSTDQTRPLTLSAWAKGASGGMGTWRTILGTNTSLAEIAFASDNTIRFGQNGGGGWWEGSPSMVADTWYHIVGTYDGTNARLYVNGNLVSGPTARTFTNAHGVTLMGRYSTGGGEWMNGQVDDARVYNYALTANQVKQLYNQGGAVRFGPTSGSL